jgi:hypothetical protein
MAGNRKIGYKGMEGTMKRNTRVAIAATALGAALAGALMLNAFGSQVAPITAHGQVETSVGIFDGDTPADAFPDIQDGGQVTVTGPSGVVLATGTLAETSAPGTVAVWDFYTFTVTVPGGQARYGIQIGRDRGTVWYSGAEMRSGPALCVGDAC